MFGQDPKVRLLFTEYEFGRWWSLPRWHPVPLQRRAHASQLLQREPRRYRRHCQPATRRRPCMNIRKTMLLYKVRRFLHEKTICAPHVRKKSEAKAVPFFLLSRSLFSPSFPCTPLKATSWCCGRIWATVITYHQVKTHARLDA